MKANQNIAKALTTVDNLDKNGERIPLLIMSKPGFGKTSTIEMWCSCMGYKLVTLIASTYAADDIVGLATVQDNKLVRMTPPWYDRVLEASDNNKNRVVLFIDELGATDSFTLSPLLNLIFNHEIEDKKLPENTLIVSASNYSEDLNNAFKMSAPLVNRFMVLNLWNEDYSVNELLNDDFENVKTKEEIKKYLGLDNLTGNKYSVDRFKDWIKTTNEITFGKSEITEDPKYGMLGFTSVRSLNYSLKFMSAYTNTFNDTLWMRIVGDTLGKSEKREGKLLRVTIENNADQFIKGKDTKVKRTIAEICNDFSSYSKEASKSKGVAECAVTLPDELYYELNEAVESISAQTITTKDISILTALFHSRVNDEILSYINNKLTEKLKAF